MYLMPAGRSVRNRKLGSPAGGGMPPGAWYPGKRWTQPAPAPLPPPMPFDPIDPTSNLRIAGRYWWNQQPQPIIPTQPTQPAIPGGPVPVGYPTNQIFVDTTGNQWQFNVSSGQWVTLGNPLYSGAQYYYPGTPVPQGYPTNQIFTDAAGNQWQFQSGTWVNTGSATSTTTSQLSPSGEPSPSVMTPPPASSYQSILDWLTEQTLVGGIPNWVMAAGVGFLALKLSSASKGGR